MLNNISAFKLSAMAALIGGSMLTTPALANVGTVHFIGSVTDVTCDITAVTDDGTETSVIDLGTMETTAAEGAEVNFTLASRDGTSCDVSSLEEADITWSGATLTPQGLSNINGTAQGVHIALKSGGTDINSNNQTATVTLNGTPKTFSAPHSAKIVATGGAGSATAGTVESNAVFAVAFK